MKPALEEGLSPDATFQRLRDASAKEDLAKRELAFYLDEVDRRGLTAASPYANVVHFAENQLDMDPRRTREFLQVGRGLRNLKLLDRAFAAGKVSWSKVVRMLKVVQVETQAAWVEFASTHTWEELRHEVRRCRPGELPGHGTDFALPAQFVKYTLRLPLALQHVLDNTLALYRARHGGKEMSINEFLIEMLIMAADQAAQESGLNWVPKLPYDERNHEDLAPGVRDAILRRDEHKCACCNRLYNLHVHHIKYRSSGGSNEPHNLLTLCDVCHASVHAGYLVIDGDPETGTLELKNRDGQSLYRGVRHALDSV